MKSETAPLYQVSDEAVLNDFKKLRLLALEQLKCMKRVSYENSDLSMFNPDDIPSFLLTETWHHLRMLLRCSGLMIDLLEAKRNE